MEAFDLLFKNTSAYGVNPLISLAIFTILGSFFLGAFLKAVRKGIKEERWFIFNKEKEYDSKRKI